MDSFNRTGVVYDEARDGFLLFLYSVTAVVALVGNTMVCRIAFSSTRLAQSVNAFIASMAVSDIIGGLTIPAQWFFCSKWLLDQGFWPELICATIKGLQVASFYISSLTMMLCAFDRYMAIIYPLKKSVPAKPLIYGTWIATLIFVASTMGSAKVFEYFTPDRLITCRIVLEFKRPFDSRSGRQLRAWGIWLFQYIVPLLVTAVLYWRVAAAVWQRKSVGSDAKAQRDAKFKRRTVFMLITVVVVFALCWLPLHALNFYNLHLKKIETKKTLSVLSGSALKTNCNNSSEYFVLYWLGISSCCYNPFIYWWFNPDFRVGINRLVSALTFGRLGRTEASSGAQMSTKGSSQATSSTGS